MNFRERWKALVAYRPRLLARVALALGLVGLLPLGFLAWRLTGITEASLNEQLLRSQAVAARTAAERIDAFLGERQAAAGALSRKLERASGPVDGLVLAELEALDPSGVLGASVVNTAGVEVVRVQSREAAARTTPAGFEGDAPALLAATDQVLPKGSASAGAAVSATPLLRVAARFAGGEVRLLFDATPLIEILAPAEVGRQAQITLLGPSARPVWGPPEALAGFPSSFLAAAANGRVVQAAQRLADPRGGSFLAAAAPLGGAPWSIVTRQPTAVAEETVQKMNRAAAVSLAAAVGLIALLGLGAYRGLVRPIRALTRAQERIARVAPAAGTAAGDEIGDLTRTFRVLEERLRDREAFDRVFLGRYQVVEVLGGGAMGTLFRGWDPRLDRPVAIKTVRFAETDPQKREVLRQRLLREAVTTARFSHPNIVSVYDALDAPEGAFVVMEFIDGASLQRVLRGRASLPPDQVALLGHAVASGLAAAHAHGVVHRDVTPGNVFLGRAGAIKLGDFGIAELLALSSTRTGRVFGTPGFIPPEACLGEPFVPAGDVFSLGVVLYLCLTGTHPFLAGGVRETMMKTAAGSFEPPRALDPALPEELERVVVRAMSRSAAERPTAEALARSLDAYCARAVATWRAREIVPEGDDDSATLLSGASTRQWAKTLGTRPAPRSSMKSGAPRA
jgi:serine/threonine-protein kinase